jgi:hypothetical protein
MALTSPLPLTRLHESLRSRTAPSPRFGTLRRQATRIVLVVGYDKTSMQRADSDQPPCAGRRPESNPRGLSVIRVPCVTVDRSIVKPRFVRLLEGCASHSWISTPQAPAQGQKRRQSVVYARAHTSSFLAFSPEVSGYSRTKVSKV